MGTPLTRRQQSDIAAANLRQNPRGGKRKQIKSKKTRRGKKSKKTQRGGYRAVYKNARRRTTRRTTTSD
jgi:hypothetical protein